MFDTLKEAAKLGAGAVSLSQENLKKITANLVEIGKVSREEGERLFAEMDEARLRHKANLGEAAEKAVRQVIDQMGLVTRDELVQLQERTDRLEAELAALKENDSASAGDGPEAAGE